MNAKFRWHYISVWSIARINPSVSEFNMPQSSGKFDVSVRQKELARTEARTTARATL